MRNVFPSGSLLLLVSQQLEVLVDLVTELVRHFFASGQKQIVTVTVDLASESVLEPLQSFEHKRLEPGNLFRVPVGARIVELPHRLDDFAQVTDLTEVFGIQEPLQFLGLGATLTELALPLPHVPRIKDFSGPSITGTATAERRPRHVATTSVCRAALLALLTLALALSLLTLALVLSLSLSLLALTLLAILALPLLTVLALLTRLTLLVRRLLATLLNPLFERLEAPHQVPGPLERLFQPCAL